MLPVSNSCLRLTRLQSRCHPSLRRRWLALAGLFIGFCGLESARAGQLQVTAHVIADGGSASSSQRFQLVGAIGQPEAGLLKSDRYTLAGGFWADPAAMLYVGVAQLTISVTTTNSHELVWSAAWKNWFLQQFVDEEWIDLFPPRQQIGGEIHAVVIGAGANPIFRLSAVGAPPPPRLEIQIVSLNTVQLSWPVTEKPWQLQQSPTIQLPEWRDVLIPPETVSNSWRVQVSATEQRSFYRLAKASALPGPTLDFALTTTNSAIISWPVTMATWQLQQATHPNAENWTNVPVPPQEVGTDYQVVVYPLAINRFYRLAKVAP